MSQSAKNKTPKTPDFQLKFGDYKLSVSKVASGYWLVETKYIACRKPFVVAKDLVEFYPEGLKDSFEDLVKANHYCQFIHLMAIQENQLYRAKSLASKMQKINRISRHNQQKKYKIIRYVKMRFYRTVSDIVGVIRNLAIASFVSAIVFVVLFLVSIIK